jgi:hypothetical protein
VSLLAVALPQEETLEGDDRVSHPMR